MTRAERQDFEDLILAIETDDREQPDPATRAICVLCRIALALVPEPLPEIQLHADDPDARQGRDLLRDAIELFTDPETRLDLRDWTKEARTLVAAHDHDPVPTTEGRPIELLPTIQQDADHEKLFPRRATDE